MTEQDKFKDSFNQKLSEGMIDMKVTLAPNCGPLTAEEICKALNDIDVAVVQGGYAEFDFCDSGLQRKHTEWSKFLL